METESLLQSIQERLAKPETEETWQAKDVALKALRGILASSNRWSIHKNLTAIVYTGSKACLDGILQSANSLRTTLALNACATIQDLSSCFLTAFDPHVETCAIQLLKVVSQTKKVIVNAGNTAVQTVLKHASFNMRVILIFANGALADKNPQVRSFCVLFLLAHIDAVISASSEPTLTLKRILETIERAGAVDAIERVIKKTIVDASPTVRVPSRDLYMRLEAHWPERATSLISTCDASVQKSLKRAPDKVSRKVVDLKQLKRKQKQVDTIHVGGDEAIISVICDPDTAIDEVESIDQTSTDTSTSDIPSVAVAEDTTTLTTVSFTSTDLVDQVEEEILQNEQVDNPIYHSHLTKSNDEHPAVYQSSTFQSNLIDDNMNVDTAVNTFSEHDTHIMSEMPSNDLATSVVYFPSDILSNQNIQLITPVFDPSSASFLITHLISSLKNGEATQSAMQYVIQMADNQHCKDIWSTELLEQLLASVLTYSVNKHIMANSRELSLIMLKHILLHQSSHMSALERPLFVGLLEVFSSQEDSVAAACVEMLNICIKGMSGYIMLNCVVSYVMNETLRNRNPMIVMRLVLQRLTQDQLIEFTPKVLSAIHRAFNHVNCEIRKSAVDTAVYLQSRTSEEQVQNSKLFSPVQHQLIQHYYEVIMKSQTISGDSRDTIVKNSTVITQEN